MSKPQRLALILSLATIALLSPSPGAATCEVPPTLLSAQSGASLPPNPTLWLFEPRPASAALQSNAPFTETSLGRSGSFRVRRLQFTAGSGELRVEVAGREYRFPIERTWNRGERRPTMGEATVVQGRDSCSDDDHIDLPVRSTAQAFHVRWAGGQTIVPQGWGRGGHLKLGRMSCLGSSVAGPRPTEEAYVVTALYADGSRSVVRVQLSDPSVPAPLPWDGPLESRHPLPPGTLVVPLGVSICLDADCCRVIDGPMRSRAPSGETIVYYVEQGSVPPRRTGERSITVPAGASVRVPPTPARQWSRSFNHSIGSYRWRCSRPP